MQSSVIAENSSGHCLKPSEMGSLLRNTLRLCLVGFAALYIIRNTQSILTSFLALFLLYVVLGGHRKLRIIASVIHRDFSGVAILARRKWELRKRIKSNQTVPMVFKEFCDRHPDKVMLISDKRTWTFRQVDEFTNKVAMAFLNMGFCAGDNVALFMENRPEFFMIWLGLSKIGVVTALINTNLKSIQLVHCINVVNIKAVIFTPVLNRSILEVYPQLKEANEEIQLFCYGEKQDFGSVPVQQLQPLIESAEDKAPSFRGNITDRLLYLYTSGTTGLPKAAIIKHVRYLGLSAGIKHAMPIKEDDIIYLCLPLYHGASGLLGIGQTIVNGTTAVIVSKFSATKFWDDCAKYNCTVAQYIGETCRYLLAQPKRKSDRGHKIRMMYGNGLRPQIWEEFRDRFGIQDLREVYGSTENNLGLSNIDNTVGAIGFIPQVLKFFPNISRRVYPLQLIRVDETTGVPLRDHNGLCITASPGEIGELITIVKSSAVDTFDGYVDKAATSKKLYRDVFQKGDIAYSSGDLLFQDELGYLYFKDRTGDTFRWKGENVSTTEVEGIFIKVVGLSDVIVYGVEVPGCEGKAGMAAIVDPEHKIDLEQMLQNLSTMLAAYAIPLFLRVLKEVDASISYRFRKTDLAKQAFDIHHITDPVYFLDLCEKKYVPLTEEVYTKILNKQVRI